MGEGLFINHLEPIFGSKDKLQIVDKQILPQYSLLSRVF